MRRRKTNSFRCGFLGCNEVGHYQRRNREDDKRQYKRYGNGKYRCVRHSAMGENLSSENRERRSVLVLKKLGSNHDSWRFRRVCGERVSFHGPTEPLGLFWVPQSGKGLNSGFAHGLGWKAFAEDFPEGTEIEVIARVKLPEEKVWK